MAKYDFVMTDDEIQIFKVKKSGVVKQRSIVKNKLTDRIFEDFKNAEEHSKAFLKFWFDEIKNVKWLNVDGYVFDIENNTITKDGQELPFKGPASNAIIKFVFGLLNVNERIVEIELKSFIAFIEKLQQTDSFSILNELYLFIKNNDIEISDDGDVICYKVVDPEYKDLYTHTISNKVGEIVEMDRKLISDDRTQTCSYGLHAASLKYLRESGYGAYEGNHLMKIVVNPVDFVSVPIDYDGAKARVCKYTVVDEIDINQILPEYSTDSEGYILH